MADQYRSPASGVTYIGRRPNLAGRWRRNTTPLLKCSTNPRIVMRAPENNINTLSYWASPNRIDHQHHSAWAFIGRPLPRWLGGKFWPGAAPDVTASTFPGWSGVRRPLWPRTVRATQVKRKAPARVLQAHRRGRGHQFFPSP